MAFNLPPPRQRLDSSSLLLLQEKRRRFLATKGKLANTIFISVPSLSLTILSLPYPCQLLYHFNEYLPGNGLISMAKYLFLSGVDLVCLKPTARTDRLSALAAVKQ